MPRVTCRAARNSSRRQRFLTSHITHRPSFSRRRKTSRGATSDRCGSILPKKSRRRLHESKRSGVARLTRNARNRRFITLWRRPGFTSASGSASTTVARFIGFVFLNVAFITALVWLAYVAARMIFPEQVALRLGVPLLIAAVPQDAFYGIDNDVLSPICFGLVFICLIKWFSQNELTVSLGIVTGL